MFVKRKKPWEIPENRATPEHVFWNRRKLMAASGLVAAGAVGCAAWFGGRPGSSGSALATTDDPSAVLYPVERNSAYTIDPPLTPENLATSYNNFYEFGSHKRIAKRAQALPIRPWTVEISGMVEQTRTIDIDDLLVRMPLEERLYRLRCVETWSMTVPWSGFPIKALVEFARPLSGARYVLMQTFENSSVASGQKQSWYPWPYTEGLTMAEATNDLAFMVTGAYGKPVPKQNGAPLRLAVPWKYGFKSIKSIVRVEFTDRRPISFWEQIAGNEYGFWANVNPDVPHPRWSQAMEQPLGTNEKIPTLLYNGYADQVAHLYKGLENEPLFR